MRLDRTLRAALVFVFVGMLGGLGSAIDGSAGSPPPPPEPIPEMATWLDFANQTLTIDAWGGAPGGLGAIVLTVGWGPLPGLMVVPVIFDAVGEAQVVVPIANLNSGYDLLIGIEVAALAADGTPLFSPMWALQTRNYVVTDPENPPCTQCPTSPGGWANFVPWPGATGGPTYPHTQVAINSDEPRSGGQPMLALESGPAGSFPIN